MLMILPQAILFDMDGTLTKPLLDFPRIKQEMGIGQRPILESLAEMDAAARRHAEEVLLRHEIHAAENCQLNKGCEALLAWLRERRIGAAVITRNSRKCAQIVLGKHGIRMGVLITRDDGRFKPDPAPLLEACGRLSVNVNEAWMVGDGQYDVEAALAAGMPAVWVSHGRTRAFAAVPTLVVYDLVELTAVLKGCQGC
jgi:HAD superfamily hydrolase (TIGR01509 family)